MRTQAEYEARAHCLILTAEALSAQFEFDGMLLIGTDIDGRVSMGGAGMDTLKVLTLLEESAKRIRKKHGIPPEMDRIPVMPVGQDISDLTHCGECPQCQSNVFGPMKRPAEIEAWAAVCECGSFLVPVYNDLDTACGVQVMTMEHVASLPDDVRNTLISLRRDGKCTGVMQHGGEHD